MGGLLILALLSGTTVSTFSLFSPPIAHARRRLAELALRRLYDIRMTQVPGYLENWNPDLFLQTLNEQRPENQSGIDCRGFEWHYWHSKLLPEQTTLTGHRRAVSTVAFSQDGSRLISGSIDGWVFVRETESGRTILAFDPGPGAYQEPVAVSPDGLRIAAIAQARVRVLDALTGGTPR